MKDDDLLRSLESGRPAVTRVLAAQALSGRTAPEVIGGLTRALSDPAPVVRVAAAQALATSAASLIRGAAETLRGDSAIPAVTSVELLGSTISVAGYALWRSILESADSEARTRAAEIIVSLPYDRTVAYLRDALDAPGSEAIAAAAVLAPLGDERAVEILRDALGDDSALDETRRLAARGLLDCRTPDAGQVLADALNDDRLILAWHSTQSVETADLIDDAIASGYGPLKEAGSMARNTIIQHIERTHEDGLDHALDALISVDDHDARLRGGDAILALGADETIDALADLVEERFDDTSAQLCEVAVVLGQIHDPRALPLLMRLAEHADWYTQLFAIESIGKHRDPAAAELLYSIARQGRARLELRRKALLAVAELTTQEEGAVEALLACVVGEPAVGPHSRLTRLAGRLLAKFGLNDAIDPLRARLADTGPAVRQSAAWALGEMSAVAGVPDLISRLAFDDNSSVRQAVAWALGQMGDDLELLTALTPALVGALADEPLVRDQAALSLGKLRFTETTAHLGREAAAAVRSALAQDQPAFVQDRLIWAAGELKDENVIPRLLSLLVKGEPLVRRRSAEALGRIGALVAGSQLCRRLVVETDPDVRTAVIHALGELAWVDARDALHEAARDPQAIAVRRAAVQVLGRVGDEDSLRLLRDVAQADRDQIVRETARLAIDRLLG